MIRPLSNHVLIEMVPESTNGILVAEQFQEKPKIGIVRAVGPWKRIGDRYVLPEVRPGQKVIVQPTIGTKLKPDPGLNLKLVEMDDVLAVIDS